MDNLGELVNNTKQSVETLYIGNTEAELFSKSPLSRLQKTRDYTAVSKS